MMATTTPVLSRLKPLILSILTLRSPEEAWLAGRVIGSAHEAWHFMESARLLRRANADLRDDSTLLRQLDILRNRVGDGFAYCSLSRALKDLHRPSLNSPVLLKRLRDECRRPCPDNEARQLT
jgi:hypothetical protein